MAKIGIVFAYFCFENLTGKLTEGVFTNDGVVAIPTSQNLTKGPNTCSQQQFFIINSGLNSLC